MSEFIYSSPADISFALRSESEIRELKRQHTQEMRQEGILEAYEYSVDLVLGELILQIASQEESIKNGLDSDDEDLRMYLLSQIYPAETTELLTLRMYSSLQSTLEAYRFEHDNIQSNRSSGGVLLPAYEVELDEDPEPIPRNFILGKIDPLSGLEMYGTSIDLIQAVDASRNEQRVTKTFTVDQVNMLIDHHDQQLSAGLFTDEAFHIARSYGDVDGLATRDVANTDLKPTLFR